MGVLRESVVLALSQQKTVRVVGSSDLSVHPRTINASQPDALLLDISRPEALGAAKVFRSAMPEVKIVALGVAEVEAAVVACAEAGVSGFITPDGSVQDIVTAIHSTVRDELVCSPKAAAMLFRLVSAQSVRSVTSDADAQLTPREREIFVLLGAGLANKHIAQRLRIQNATVKNHVHSILGKLGVSRRGEAAAHLFQSVHRSNELPHWSRLPTERRADSPEV